MATRKARQGLVVGRAQSPTPSSQQQRLRGVRDAPPTASEIRSGKWRPNRDFRGGDGIRIAMHRVKGLTKKNVLMVPFRFQCPIINDFTREGGYDHAKYQTLRVGERSRPTGATLRTWTIQTLFLDEFEQSKVNFVIWPFKPFPQRLLRELRHIEQQGTPFKLVCAQAAIWSGDALINSRAVLTNISSQQKNGEPGVEYVDLTFEEYLETDDERKTRAREEDEARTHTLKSRDTLYEIAKHYYRSPSAWRAIAKANGITRVSPDSSSELAAWAKKHHVSKLKLPGRDVAVFSGPLPQKLPKGYDVLRGE